MSPASKRPGTSFDDFLKSEGLYDDVQNTALKRVLVWQLKEEMTRQSLTKVEVARRMDTSRSQLDRLLDPDNEKVELATLRKAAQAVGRELQVSLV